MTDTSANKVATVAAEGHAFSPNRFAATLMAFVVLVWVIVMLGLLVVGTRFDPAPGRMLVLFSRSLSPDEALDRVLGQGGLLIGDGVAGRLWTAYSEQPEFAQNMRANGAVALWRREAFDWMFSTGCTGDTAALTRAQTNKE